MNAPDANPIFRVPNERADKHHWTTAEEAILREHYPAGAAFACIAPLPGRTLGSIYQHARNMGLRAPTGHPGYSGVKKYHASEAIDAAVRRVYTAKPTRRAVQELAARLMRPRWWVCKRAAALGLSAPRFKDLPWSRREIELLNEHASSSPDVLCRVLQRNGFRRTPAAIGIQLKRRGIDRTDPDHWTAHQLAALLGVDGKTVTRWISVEGLPAEHRGTPRVAVQGGDQWWIGRKRLRAWISTHAQLIDLRKVERFWFLDLVFHR